jgi:hypothetical protein
MHRTSIAVGILVSALLPLAGLSAQPATASEVNAPTPGGPPSGGSTYGNNASHNAPTPGGTSSGGSTYGNNASHNAPTPGGTSSGGSTYGENAEHNAPTPGGTASGGSTYGNNAEHNAPTPGGPGKLKIATSVPPKVLGSGGSKGTSHGTTGSLGKGSKTSGTALSQRTTSKGLLLPTSGNHPNDSTHKHPAH